MTTETQTPRSLSLCGTALLGNSAYDQILTPEALTFITLLHNQFNEKRKWLLQQRQQMQEQMNNGLKPSFFAETENIRSSEWQVAPIPAIIQDRRVEITGPVERKMIINALNSGAKVFMADFEDSNSPGWDNLIQGQINLKDAIQKTISYEHPETGKTYRLHDETAVIFVRPRGLHMQEKHLEIDGEQVSASLVDFGLYMFHNAAALVAQNKAPFFYLPKLEHYTEARWWNSVFCFAQDYLRLPVGTIKATVLVETITATFQLHEILWELKEHSAGLNCGRWDYIFSFIKKFKNIPGYIFPERGQVTMTVPFMRAYTQLVIQTCHRRGIHAIGGMAAQIPIRNNEEANQSALEKVKADKVREVKDGHDGTWVAHPGLVPIATEVFDAFMKTPNQIHKKREDFSTTAGELLALPKGTITETGFRMNINVGILYIESWLRGNGAAALYHLMEDAATAEISRTQVWQWLRAGAKLVDGRTVNINLYKQLRNEEVKKIQQLVGNEAFLNGKFEQAIELFDELVQQQEFTEFLTTTAYDFID